MKVEILSRKLIKPSTPTPSALRSYNISFTDKLSPTINVPLILYFPATFENVPSPNHILFTRCYHLEKSLEKTLTKFYPFAGRYIKDVGSIDCSDQGVDYVLAKANIQLLEILGGVKPKVLNNFLPCEIGAADEIFDPLLSIQMTMFDCGGLAIGFCFSHRVSDMGTFTLFIDSWAASSKTSEGNALEISPIFNVAILFPPRDLPSLDLRVPRTRTAVANDAKKFLFNERAILSLRAMAGVKDVTQPKPSKVQLVIALLYKAIIGTEKARNNGRSKASFLFLPANLRDKVVPPLPKESFGNFWGLATASLEAGEGDNIEYKGFVDLISDSIRKKVRDFTKLVHGDEGSSGIVINPFLQANDTMARNDVSFYLFTCWSKFSFYEADFGWGKPIWASTANLPLEHVVILMDDADGNGIEAWVHLDEKDMLAFQQDPKIKAFAIY